MKCSLVGLEIPVQRWSRLFAASIVCALIPLAAWAQTVGISTVAGQAGIPGATDATGTLAQFNNPAGLAADGTTVYVADSANNRIRKLTISTGAVAIFGGTGVFNGPSGVTVDGSGNAFVADTLNHVIRKITPGGVVSVQAGAVGVFGATDGTMALARFNNPQGVAVTSGGLTYIYVADTGNNVVRRIDVGGDAVTTVASGFKPVGLALNAAGTILYVTDFNGHTIRSLTVPGHVLATVAGTIGTPGSTDSPALFRNPSGISVDSAGDLYVADTGNHTIRKIVVAGPTVTTIAGLAGSIGNTDGLGTGARFNAPFGIVATGVNSFYVADSNNHTIRRASPTSAPGITSANNATFTLNAAGTFTVTATGSPAPTFSITAGSLPSGVAINPTSGVIAGTPTAGGTFPVTIQASNGVGSPATQAFTLTVTQPPVFTSANNATFSLGVFSTFTLTATGAPAPTFGLVSGSFPPWASLNTLSGAISGTPTNTTGSPFAFVVSAANPSGSVNQAFTLTVGASSPAAITLHPVSAAVNVGLNATFTGAATGSPTPTLQWQRQPASTVGFVNLTEAPPYSGTTTGTLTVTGVTAGMGGDQFQLVATNIGATVTSTAATLSINAAIPAFVTHPANTTVTVGLNGTFTATASGNPTPTLRWQRLAAGGFVFVDLNDDATYSGTTSNTLTITTTTVAMNGDQFRAVATNINGVTPSNAAALTVSATLPTITLQPLPVIANVGGVATFTANGTGVPAPTFRWQRQPNGTTGFVDLTDDGTFGGTTSATLTIAAVTPGMNGDLFRLVVANAGGSTPSNAALLTVNLGTTISTFAGQATVAGAVDATGVAARFSGPASIAVDLAGNFYIADTGNSVIRRMTAGGVVTTLAGLAGSPGAVDGPVGAARFNSPSGVAVDSAGNVYVADAFSHTIRLISGGVVTTLAGAPGIPGTADGVGSAARFFRPSGVAVDGGGNVYVADSSNHTIRRITLTGSVTTYAGTALTPGLVDSPTATSARFNSPNALVLDAAGNLYVADSQNNVIRKITPAGVVTTIAGNLAGSPGSTDGNGPGASFFRPSGIAIDATNNLYVSETVNNTIRKITATGDVTTLAGLATASGSADGLGSLARFNRPFGIAVDINGNIYVADTGNHTIRRTGTTSAPQITTQPANRGVATGQSATFTVVASGSPPPTSFQWQRQAANTFGFVNLAADLTYSGVTTPTLTVANVSLLMVGDQFRVVVANGVSPVAVSDVATLTVGTPPTFTSVAAASFRAGQANTFTVAADSPTAVTFSATGLPAWLTLNATTGVLSGNPPDTTGSPLAIAITANNGVTAVQAFVLTLLPPNLPPSILVQPASVASDPGQGATFNVTAAGTAPLSYQWRRDGIPISGATNSTFVLGGVQASAAGTYSVAITNAFGSIVSAGATLTVNTLPLITTQPGAQVAVAGGSASFTVAATGGSGFSYQWRRNGLPIAGAAGATLTVSNITAADAGNYDVIVTNNVGSTGSSIALLTISAGNAAPAITAQPAARTALLGTSVTFSIAATGVPSPALQWRKNGANIPGANGATYVLSSVQAGDAANYDVVAANSAGTVTSAPAGLTVIARSYAGAYFGSFGNGLGSFALHVREDNTAAFLGYLPGSTAPVMNLNVAVNDAGQFTFSQAAIAGGGGADGEPARAAALSAVTVNGSIANDGALTGSISGGAIAGLTGALAPATGATQHVAGFFQLGSPNNATTAYAIAGPNGQAFVVALGAGTASDGGLGSVNPAGVIGIATSRSTIALTIVPGSGLIGGSSTGAVAAASLNGGSEAALARQRLVNISSRARVGTADAVAIAGFVISGTESKPVLIRAIGPTLGTAFGLTGALASPRLELFRGNVSLGVNTGIAGNRTAIDAAGAAVGAFTLGAAGTDAAILTTLAPGNYTAVVNSTTAAAGVALVEVYDLTAATPGQKLLNISTRASAGVGENLLIAGFVVPAGPSKRVLIRGVGPGLAVFGVTGALAQPVLTLFNGSVAVASNTNWSTSADSVAISAGSVQVGAFGLANNDSAMAVTLAPGNYTAQVTGVAGGTGIALIEVYELP